MSKRRPKMLPFMIGAAAAAVIVIVLILVLSSGGGKKPGGPTKAQYLARADAICKATAARINPLIGQAKNAAPGLLTGSANAAKQLVSIFGKLHTAAGTGLSQLRALAQPSADHAAIRAFLMPLGGVVTAIGDAAGDLRSGNTAQALQLFTQTLSIASEVTSAAQSYGYSQCSQLVSALHA